ncbi:pyridoxamine 5'-phosphate oxidase family protein [Maribacter sp. X9]|uniref:pyridoxamine 5'-phosphate oxidase family protein n=1 Tax=Maribacter sp. X9 TaxID=3402159 RepID=UPI003AF3FD68
MRRNLEKMECIALLERNYIGYLGYVSGSYPHVVPITYYYDKESESLISYSSVGHKLSSMRQQTAVSLAVTEIQSVGNWKSILVLGTYEEMTGIDAKHMLHEFSNGVKKVIGSSTEIKHDFISDFSAKLETDEATVVFRIAIQEITGKIRVS